jgi:gliding motility-associated-like protein
MFSFFKKIPLVVGIALGGTPLLFSQTTFQTAYQHPEAVSWGLGVAALSGGSTVVSGYFEKNQALGDWIPAMWLLNSTGDVARTVCVEGTLKGFFNDVAPAPDGNPVALLTATDGGNRSGIVKVEAASGNLLWVLEWPDPNINPMRISAVTGGYVVTGQNFGFVEFGAFILKISDNGQILWSHKLSNRTISLFGIDEDAAGNVYVAGQEANDGLLLKLNPTGDLLWAQQYGSAQADILRDVTVLPDGRVLAAGFSEGFGATVAAAWLLETDAEGRVQRARTYSVPDRPMAALQLRGMADGSAVVSITEQTEPATNGAILLKIGANGDVLWQNAYGDASAAAYFYGLTTLPSGQLAAVGRRVAGSDQGLYVAKTDRTGSVAGCCPKPIALGVLDVEPLVTTVATALETYESLTATALPLGGFPVSRADLCPVINAEFALSDSMICPGQCLRINFPNPTDGVDYAWTFAGGTPANSPDTQPPSDICFDQKGRYEVALFAGTCAAARVEVLVDSPNDLFPNAFTPDGDGTNDVFRPIIQCPVEEYTFEVFNRWGDQVFVAYDPAEGWDGTVNDLPAPVDVYIFRVSFFVQRDGQRVLVRNEMRDVTLLR